jgi:hypothetical protein
MLRLAARRVLLVLLIGGVLIYGFAMRTGRYQLERLETTMYAVIDTATGTVWVYRAHPGRTAQGESRFDFREEDVIHGSDLLWRLRP